MSIMRDALYLNTEKGFPIPPEFYVWRRILQAGETVPVPFVPDFSAFNLEPISQHRPSLWRQGIHSLMKIVLPDGFPQQGKCLILPTNWRRCRKMRLHGLSEQSLATLLKQFMQDVITPEKNQDSPSALPYRGFHAEDRV